METYQKALVNIMIMKETMSKHKSNFENDDLKRVLFVFPTDGYRKYETQVGKELASVNQ